MKSTCKGMEAFHGSMEASVSEKQVQEASAGKEVANREVGSCYKAQ